MYLFVYGTLKKNKHNNHYLENSTYIGDYCTDNNFTLYISSLPYMVKRKNGGGVKGELYKIDQSTLKLLDKLEGVPTFYYRDLITVYDLEVGNSVDAYVYLHPDVFRNKSNNQQVREY